MKKLAIDRTIIMRQLGLSLVELMVAITIGLLLLAGVAQIFASSSRTYRVNQGLSQIQENGRFAMEFLARDLRLADFWGCTNSLANVTNNIPNAAASGLLGAINFGAGGLAGTDNTGLNGEDSILVRGAFGTGLNVQAATSLTAITTTINNGLAQNNNVIVSDCSNGDIFSISNATPGTSGLLTSAVNLSNAYQTDAQVFPVRTIIYSIAPGAAGQPALFRNNQELVDGINNLQVLYGEDTSAPGSPGVGTPNYYVPANLVVDMANVVSIRVSILVQSYNNNLTSAPQTYIFNGPAVTTAADNRLYRVFTSTITLRNRTI